MTRIASSQYKVWEDILSTNHVNIEQMIKQSIRAGGLDAIFENARNVRAEIPAGRKGLLMSYFEITVRVHDEPGTLLKISTILAEQNINIKDISVQKNREYDGGHFRLGFELDDFRSKAIELLLSKG